MRLQLPDVADAMPRLSRSEEIAIWREMRTREPPEDPFRRWAELQLAKAGLASGSTHPDILDVESHARSTLARRRPTGF
jgi:hypothetical protein